MIKHVDSNTIQIKATLLEQNSGIAAGGAIIFETHNEFGSASLEYQLID